MNNTVPSQAWKAFRGLDSLLDLRSAMLADSAHPFPEGAKGFAPKPTYQPRSALRMMFKREFSVDPSLPPLFQFLTFGQLLGSLAAEHEQQGSPRVPREVTDLRSVARTFRGIRHGGLQVEAMENVPVIPSLLGEEISRVEDPTRPYSLVHLVAYLATREPIDVDAIHRWDSVDRPQLVEALKEYCSLSDIDAIHRIELLMGHSNKPPVLTGNH